MSKKSIVRSLCAFTFAAACLAGAVDPVYAWDTINIDNETHRDNPSLVQGTYTDWTNLPNPWRDSWWPWVMNTYSRYTSTWDVGQERHGVAVWRIQIPKTGWYNIKTTYKQTDNRTTAANYEIYIDATLADIENNTMEPVYQEFVNQYGEATEEFHWADFGAFCLKQGNVSVLALDARETDRSSSADSAEWTYLGEVYNSEKCENPPPPLPKTFAPTNYLLLRDKKDMR
jgi:hypothetical protein